MKNSNQKGITLIALMVTVIITLILASIGTYEGIQAITNAKENKYKSELGMIQHTILERYAEYKVTKNPNILLGTEVEYSSVLSLANEIGVTELRATSNYYELTPENLAKMGVKEAKDTYIVNYTTGEVINKTIKTTPSGDVLYTYAK